MADPVNPQLNSEQLQVEQPQQSVKPASEEQVKFVTYITIGITIVLLICLVTLILQYFSATQATFQLLRDQVHDQNNKIEMLSNKIDLLINTKK